jgi:hypothetical protein
MKELNTLKAFAKWFNEIPTQANMHELEYTIERLEDAVSGLYSFAKFRVGNNVILNKTPVINEKVAWGWLGCKHFLIEGAQAIVCDVDWYKGRFRYGIKFEEKPTSVFTFNEEDLMVSEWEEVNVHN